MVHLAVAARRLWSRRQGSVAIFFAVTLSALIGFAALGTEIGYAMFKQRQMQSAASAAAVSGAIAYSKGIEPLVEAKAVAAAGGFTHGTAGATVTVNRPPLAGAYAGIAGAVEVVVGQPLTLPLSALFYVGPWNVNARAVATVGSSAGYCLLELDSSNATGVSVSNGATLALNQCGLAVNATGPGALTVIGGATVNAKSVWVVGLISMSGGGAINVTDTKKTSQPAVSNPYAGVAIPSSAGCTPGATAASVLGWQNPTLNPGLYCGGLNIGSGGGVTLNPGVYIMKGGAFTLGGGTSLTGTGVTIVLTGNGTDYATASIGNGSSVTLSAPTTGATAGLLFFQDPAAPTTKTSNFQGGSTLKLTGALYFPTQTVAYSNGASAGAACTQLIAWRLQFTGGASFNSNCGGTGVQTIGTSPSRLVE